MMTHHCIDRARWDNHIGHINENIVPKLLHDFAAKLGIMLEWILLLRYPSYKHRDENSTPDLVVDVARKITIFRPLGRLPSILLNLQLSLNHKSLLSYNKFR